LNSKEAKAAKDLSVDAFWDIKSKKCDDRNLTPAPFEFYFMNRSTFAKLVKASEDDTSFCRFEYAYDKYVSSSTKSDLGYSETANLKSSFAKKTCWYKDGRILSDEGSQFGPEEMNYQLTANESTASIDIMDGQDCPKGTLHLELQ